MQLLVFFAAIAFIVLRIYAGGKKNQVKNSRESDIADLFATDTGETDSDVIRPVNSAARNRTEGSAYVSGSACGTANCTGGSIHEGAHEGEARAPYSAPGMNAARRTAKNAPPRPRAAAQTAQTAQQKPPAPSRQGAASPKPAAPNSPYAQSSPDDSANESQNGADRLLKAISSQPAAVQGVIWNEILSAPAAVRNRD